MAARVAQARAVQRDRYGEDGATTNAEADIKDLDLQADARILAEQAALLEEAYRTNPDLTAFEAFGEDDLYGESADSETR